MPPDATVRFLGDGKFDGTGLQAVLRRKDWQNVCRIASNVLVKACGVQFPVGDPGLPRGELVPLTPAYLAIYMRSSRCPSIVTAKGAAMP
jgi:hypothetical protein